MNPKSALYGEKEQIIALQEGDKASFDKIFGFYSRKVYRFCYGYLKSREDSEEIVQDTFVKLWLTRDALDENQSLSGYLFNIAYRLVLNRIRKNQRQQAGQEKWLLHSTNPHNLTEEQLNFAELEHLTQTAISSLPPKRKAIFQMSRHLNMSHQQIAEQLGISKKTVESQITEALKHLKHFLSNHGHWLPLLPWCLFILP